MKKHDFPYGYIPNNGDKFLKWTVIDNTIKLKGPEKFKSRYILCKCECGVEREIQIIRLMNATSNGCNLCSTSREWSKTRCKEGASGTLSRTQYAYFRHCAERRNYTWEVSMDYLWSIYEKQEGKCKLSGIPLILNISFPNKKGRNTASLDRIDSTIGYIEGNVQWVHKDINRMKSNFSDERFVEVCKLVAKHQETTLI